MAEVAISPDGTVGAAVDYDGLVSVWDRPIGLSMPNPSERQSDVARPVPGAGWMSSVSRQPLASHHH